MMTQKTIAKHEDLEVIEVHISFPLTRGRGRKWWKLVRGDGLPYRRCATKKEAMGFFDVLCLSGEDAE